MTLYISNTTKQRHMFPIRREGHPQIIPLVIESGSQIELTDREWHKDMLTLIVLELERRYKAVDITETNRHPEGYSGLAYRWDRPVTQDQIHAGHDIVVTNQQKISAAEATKAALGADRALNKIRSGRRVAEVTAVEVIQDVDRRVGPSGNEVVFGLAVDPNGGDLQLAS